MNGTVLESKTSASERLSAAFQACGQVIDGLDNDRRAALSFVRDVRESLRAGQQFWDKTSQLLQVARPGQMTEEEFTRLQAEFDWVRGEIESTTNEVEEAEALLQSVSDKKEELHRLQEEKEKLEYEKTDLENLETLRQQTDDLRTFVERLRKRADLKDLPVLRSQIDDLLTQTLTLSHEQEQALGQHLSNRLKLLADTEQRLREKHVQLVETTKQAQQQQKDLEQICDALGKYAQADQEIADIVPGASEIRAALRLIQEQLEAIDRILHIVCKANEDETVKRLVAIDFTGAPLHQPS